MATVASLSDKNPGRLDFRLIAAVAMNGVIGRSESNSMPWNIPSDLKWFKECTFDNTVIMGSNTFRSLPKILPNRKNVVVTRYINELPNNVTGCHSLVDAIKGEKYRPFVIGGAQIYEAALKLKPLQLYITLINDDPIGDVKFPVRGDIFNDDVIEMPNDQYYHCSYRSDWMTENDHDFQFTIFNRS